MSCCRNCAIVRIDGSGGCSVGRPLRHTTEASGWIVHYQHTLLQSSIVLVVVEHVVRSHHRRY